MEESAPKETPTKDTNDKNVSSLASELLKYGSGTFGKRVHDQYVSMYLKHGPDAALAALGHKLDSQPKLLPKVQKELGISSIQTMREKMSSMPDMQFPVNARKRVSKEKTQPFTEVEHVSEIAEAPKALVDAVPIERPEMEKQEETQLVMSEQKQPEALKVEEVQSREMFQAPDKETMDVPKVEEGFEVVKSYKRKKRPIHRYLSEGREQSYGPYSREQYEYIKRRDPGYLS